MDVIRELCSFESRLAGTDAERRAANLLADATPRAAGGAPRSSPPTCTPGTGSSTPRTARSGSPAACSPSSSPRSGSRSCWRPPSRCTWTSTTALYLVRRLFFRRASQNVVSPGERPTPPPASCCAPTTTRREPAPSSIRSAVARGARLARRLPLPLGPFRILFWSLALLLPILGARMAGIDSNLISAAPAPPHPDPPRRRLPADRHRALRRRPGRQRQRLRRRDRALARRGARRRTRPSISTSGCS